MGSELTKENKPDFEKDFQDENIKYGIISKKCKEQSNDDSYIISPNINISEGDINIDFSLFGIFDGHNGNCISKYLSENINKFFEKEIKNIDNNNYQHELEKLFSEIDNTIKTEQNKINVKVDKNNIDIAEIEVKDSDKEFFINSIKTSSDIPDEFKEIDNNELEDLLLFKNLFNFKNNYIHNTSNLNYIGSSASIVLINSDKIITMNLGITKCFLLDKEGNILNAHNKSEEQTEEKNKKIKNEHTFNNIEEKKRIKKFNKDIDYESLKMNCYIPTSRSFGFYKYKSNDLLNSNNQIISCIPDIEIFDIKNVEFIFLVTGLDLSSKRLKKLTKKIKELNLEQNEEIKYTKIIEDLLPDFKKEKKSKKEKEEINEHNNQLPLILDNDNIEEENILLDQLDNEYYKDLIELNEPEIIHDKNTTCILIKIYKKKANEKDKENKENQENIESKESEENTENKENQEIKENKEEQKEVEKKEGEGTKETTKNEKTNDNINENKTEEQINKNQE